MSNLDSEEKKQSLSSENEDLRTEVKELEEAIEVYKERFLSELES